MFDSRYSHNLTLFHRSQSFQKSSKSLSKPSRSAAQTFKKAKPMRNNPSRRAAGDFQMDDEFGNAAARMMDGDDLVMGGSKKEDEDQ